MSASTLRTWIPLALLVACAAPLAPLDWQQFGGMREVMRDGRDEARVTLAELGPVVDVERGDLVAVGALAGLAGEVTIDGRNLWVATAPSETELVVEETAGAHAATLLTTARVPAWRELEAGGMLDEVTLGALLAKHGRLGEALPIRIEGAASSLAVHVIRGDCPHAPDAAIPAWRWEAPAATEVVLVGFYAPGAPGILTHHGTDFHLHAVAQDTAGHTVAGHVDAFELLPGARVFVGRSAN
jgi:acetolactate decarboxylase